MDPRVNASDRTWDVAVLGGGPSGMMAAGRAAEMGASVILIEKNRTLGKKLLITGGGRCNVLNGERDVRKLLAKFKDSGKFLSSPFSKWGVKESLDFFHSRGMATKEEAGQRIFPASNKAQSVLDVLTAYLQQHNVTVLTNASVTKLHTDASGIEAAELQDGKRIRARAFIISTGGTSHPETGSTGDGYQWLRSLGHTINTASAALVPIALQHPLTLAAGVRLDAAKVTLYQYDKKQTQATGKVLFTHVGLSGPCILNMSREIGDLLRYDTLTVEIDMLPDMGYEKVDAALKDAFKANANKMVKNSLKDLIAPALVTDILNIARIDGDTMCNSVKRDERIRLMKTLKHLRFEVDGLLGMDKAVITAGGVALTEVDWKEMRSLKSRNLFLTGDILDIDRPSGGYSLQLCWTTGHVAGSSAAELSRH